MLGTLYQSSHPKKLAVELLNSINDYDAQHGWPPGMVVVHPEDYQTVRHLPAIRQWEPGKGWTMPHKGEWWIPDARAMQKAAGQLEMEMEA